MRYGSVCSGIEAATIAWAPLGWEAAWYAEIDQFPQAVLRHHYGSNTIAGSLKRKSTRRKPGGVRNFGDFTTIRPRNLRRLGLAPIDLLVGGTPCQDFSIAGLRAGLDGSRGNLTIEFVRLARRLRPRWIVLENVPGFLSINGGRAFGSFLGALGQIGYGFAYRLLDAQYFGLAQRRERLFVVGYLGDWRPPAAVLFEPEGLQGHPPPRRETGARVAGTIAGGARSRGGYSTDDIPLAGALTGAMGRRGGQPDGGDTDGHLIAHETCAALDASYGRLHGASHQDANHGHSHLVAYGGNDTRGPIDVATAVNAHGGPHGRLDFESETFIATTLRVRDGSKDVDSDCTDTLIAHTLRPEGFDASEDGTGRGTPLVPIAFHGSQDPDVSGDVTHPLGRNQGQEVCVAFHENQRGELTVNDTAGALNSGGGKPGQGYPAVAFTERGRDQGRTFEAQEELAYCLTNPGLGGRTHSRQIITPTMSVRRLTPKECCRLQGIPDDYLDILYRGKPAADGPKYKALGNSFPVPVLSWIGSRIQMVEDILAERDA